MFCVHSIRLALHLNLYTIIITFFRAGVRSLHELIMEIATFFSRFISGQFYRFSELKCVFNSFKTFELSHMGKIERIFYCCMDRLPTASLLIDLWAKNLFWKCSVFILFIKRSIFLWPHGNIENGVCYDMHANILYS